ncbi:MAG: hypothetical protein PSY14_02150 [bacterium]|nr:hypothetical protein [bacterium]
MSLPLQYRYLPIEVKYNLTSYLACSDCKYAIHRLKERQISYSAWKVEWAGICALLKASVHLMAAKDAKACLPETLKRELKKAYDELRKNKEQYPLFWKFIDRERHNILKEYEFSAYEVIIQPDGTTSNTRRSLLSFMDDSVKEALLIRSGEYKTRNALDVLTEAVEWLENYIFDTIRKAGYDPNERRYAATLLPIETLNTSRRGTFIESIYESNDVE